MQTFLPYKNFRRTARVLDFRRLGKQRVEAFQILKAIREGGGWQNHPAVNMWRGFERALEYYFNIISSEWVSRGYKHNMGFYEVGLDDIDFPLWLGDENFHEAHRSRLIQKFPEHYEPLFPDTPKDLPYIWPV